MLLSRPETRRSRVPRLLLALLLLPLLLSSAVAISAQTEVRQQAPAPPNPEATKDAAIANIPLFSSRLLSELYDEHGPGAFWDEGRARQMLRLARQSVRDGFDPEDFRASEIERLIDEGRLTSAPGDRRTTADFLLSDALLRYLHHFRFGKYNPRKVSRGSVFVGKADAAGLKADMERAVASPDLAEEVDALLPHPPFYENLKRGYGRYLAIADRGGREEIPVGANLSPGALDPRVPAIRERLSVTDGFEDDQSANPQVYDENLAEAVKGFQKRSGLSADGVIGQNTIMALNRPIDDRLAKIRANLERMRWLYNDLPADYLFVDLTDYKLRLIRDHKEVWSTKVIVGTTKDQTPMFRDEMEYLVFNPTWTMPPSIQKKMRGAGKKYQVYDRRTGRRVSGANVGDYRRYRIVQPPGPRNALGRVKFIFPNGHSIYLHDTPSKHLFSRARRAYSHGCIRVHKPLTLAEHVLNDPNWDESELKRVVRRGRTRHVKLDEHLPVVIYYLTAVADDHGRVGFRRDLYNRDKPLLATLDEPAHGDRIAFPEPKPEPYPVSDPSDRKVGEQVITRPETDHPQSNRDAGDASTGDKTAKDGSLRVGAQAPHDRLEALASAGPAYPLGEIGAATKEVAPRTASAVRSDGTPEQWSSDALRVGIESPFQAEDYRLQAPPLVRRNAVGLGAESLPLQIVPR